MLFIVRWRASKAAIAITFLLYSDSQPVPGIRGRGIELPLSSGIVPRIVDTEHEETCLPDLSGQKWEGTQNAKHLNKQGKGFIVLTQHL